MEQDGISNYRDECNLVGGEIRTLKEDLELQMTQLADEVRRTWVAGCGELAFDINFYSF